MKSFFEGVVSRVNVTTPEGRFFAVQVAHEVILDRERHIGPGIHDYVRYECPKDFPGRIEVLSATSHEVWRENAPDPLSAKASADAMQKDDEQDHVELEVHTNSEIVQTSETAAHLEATQAYGESQPAPKPRRLISVLFGQKS